MATTKHDPGSFCWFECGTTDAAATTAFYTRLFGWNSLDVPMPGDAGGNYTLLKIGDEDVAGLYPLQGPMFEGVPSHWMTYVASADVDDTVARAQTLGGSITAPAMDVPGVGRIALIQDPTGARIGIFKPGEHPGCAQLGPVPGTFGWSELATRDTGAAAAFYTELFNWRARTDDNPHMAYTEFMNGDTPIGGMMEMKAHYGDTPPHWLPYVMVDDTDAIVAKVGDLGGRIIVPGTDIANVGRFAVFSEPSGAVLAVIKLEEHGC